MSNVLDETLCPLYETTRNKIKVNIFIFATRYKFGQ